MKSVRHINDHGRGVGKLVKWFSWDQHATQRFDRKIHPRHLRNACGPSSGTVHYDPGADVASRTFNPTDAAFIASNSSDFRMFPNPGAMIGSPSHEPDHRAVGIYKA